MVFRLQDLRQKKIQMLSAQYFLSFSNFHKLSHIFGLELVLYTNPH